MAYERMVVDGILVSETPTHYVTLTDNGTMTWSKTYYRLQHDS
jgi:hypothetical protein